MKRLLLAVALVSGVLLTASPARAAEPVDAADTAAQLLTFFDDGEPCTAVPNSIPGIFDFTTACQAHDDCYAQGGDKTACDLAFRQDMLALCAAQHPQALDPTRYVCQAFAVLYYTGVVIFGALT